MTSSIVNMFSDDPLGLIIQRPPSPVASPSSTNDRSFGCGIRSASNDSTTSRGGPRPHKPSMPASTTTPTSGRETPTQRSSNQYSLFPSTSFHGMSTASNMGSSVSPGAYEVSDPMNEAVPVLNHSRSRPSLWESMSQNSPSSVRQRRRPSVRNLDAMTMPQLLVSEGTGSRSASGNQSASLRRNHSRNGSTNNSTNSSSNSNSNSNGSNGSNGNSSSNSSNNGNNHNNNNSNTNVTSTTNNSDDNSEMDERYDNGLDSPTLPGHPPLSGIDVTMSMENDPEEGGVGLAQTAQTTPQASTQTAASRTLSPRTVLSSTVSSKIVNPGTVSTSTIAPSTASIVSSSTLTASTLTATSTLPMGMPSMALPSRGVSPSAAVPQTHQNSPPSLSPTKTSSPGPTVSEAHPQTLFQSPSHSTMTSPTNKTTNINSDVVRRNGSEPGPFNTRNANKGFANNGHAAIHNFRPEFGSFKDLAGPPPRRSPPLPPPPSSSKHSHFLSTASKNPLPGKDAPTTNPNPNPVINSSSTTRTLNSALHPRPPTPPKKATSGQPPVPCSASLSLHRSNSSAKTRTGSQSKQLSPLVIPASAAGSGPAHPNGAHSAHPSSAHPSSAHPNSAHPSNAYHGHSHAHVFSGSAPPTAVPQSAVVGPSSAPTGMFPRLARQLSFSRLRSPPSPCENRTALEEQPVRSQSRQGGDSSNLLTVGGSRSMTPLSANPVTGSSSTFSGWPLPTISQPFTATSPSSPPTETPRPWERLVGARTPAPPTIHEAVSPRDDEFPAQQQQKMGTGATKGSVGTGNAIMSIGNHSSGNLVPETSAAPPLNHRRGFSESNSPPIHDRTMLRKVNKGMEEWHKNSTNNNNNSIINNNSSNPLNNSFHHNNSETQFTDPRPAPTPPQQAVTLLRTQGKVRSKTPQPSQSQSSPQPMSRPRSPSLSQPVHSSANHQAQSQSQSPNVPQAQQFPNPSPPQASTPSAPPAPAAQNQPPTPQSQDVSPFGVTPLDENGNAPWFLDDDDENLYEIPKDIPAGFTRSEALVQLSESELETIQRQAMAHIVNFRLLRCEDVDTLTQERRYLGERTEYLRRTWLSLRAGRRNLHARICRYMRSPRVAKFANDSILKQEEALAELDASIEDWFTKLEKAEDRRELVTKKLAEHYALALTLPTATPHTFPTPNPSKASSSRTMMEPATEYHGKASRWESPKTITGYVQAMDEQRQERPQERQEIEHQERPREDRREDHQADRHPRDPVTRSRSSSVSSLSHCSATPSTTPSISSMASSTNTPIFEPPTTAFSSAEPAISGTSTAPSPSYATSKRFFPVNGNVGLGVGLSAAVAHVPSTIFEEDSTLDSTSTVVVHHGSAHTDDHPFVSETSEESGVPDLLDPPNIDRDQARRSSQCLSPSYWSAGQGILKASSSTKNSSAEAPPEQTINDRKDPVISVSEQSAVGNNRRDSGATVATQSTRGSVRKSRRRDDVQSIHVYASQDVYDLLAEMDDEIARIDALEMNGQMYLSEKLGPVSPELTSAYDRASVTWTAKKMLGQTTAPPSPEGGAWLRETGKTTTTNATNTTNTSTNANHTINTNPSAHKAVSSEPVLFLPSAVYRPQHTRTATRDANRI